MIQIFYKPLGLRIIAPTHKGTKGVRIRISQIYDNLHWLFKAFSKHDLTAKNITDCAYAPIPVLHMHNVSTLFFLF